MTQGRTEMDEEMEQCRKGEHNRATLLLNMIDLVAPFFKLSPCKTAPGCTRRAEVSGEQPPHAARSVKQKVSRAEAG